MWALKMVTDRSLDIYLTTEDLPRPDNRVTVDGDKIMISWTPNNLTPHHELVKRVSACRPQSRLSDRAHRTDGHRDQLPSCAALPWPAPIPSTSVLDPDCRSHDVDNLFVVDGSFFPSSAALNPALTIAANALPGRAHHCRQHALIVGVRRCKQPHRGRCRILG